MITGVKGSIRWHYYTAAAIEGYTVSCTKAGQWSLSAQVVLSDAFKMAQTPLVFVALHQGGEWRWPVTSATVDSQKRLTARLGAPLP